MEQQQDIGGAQALLSLGTKDAKHEEHDQQDATHTENHANSHHDEAEDDKSMAVQGEQLGPGEEHHRSDHESFEDKANQQLNDAVEAAVMRYVGGTLDNSESHEHDRHNGDAADGSNESQGPNTSGHGHGEGSKRRLNHEEIMSHIGDYQWDSFLEENVAADFEGPSPKRSRRRRSFVNGGDIDPDLPDLEGEPSEHDQLVHAAILGAGELAKQLSLPPTSNLHHQHQQQHQHSHRADGESAAINQLAHAASALSAKGRPRTSIKQKRPLRRPSALHSIHNQASTRDKYDHMSLESLVDQCANESLSWYHSQTSIPMSGPRAFAPTEISVMESFVDGYCRLNNLSRLDICRRVWASERTKDNFWECITKVLPYRSRASIYKHVRRQYHVFDIRAKWTAEEDELLKKLSQTSEANWKKIGETMNRMPEDCRDRWRNYIKCGENRASNKWSEEEERTLKNIVVEMITNDSNGDKPMSINWTLVSEKMNGVRSRIQCRYKWNKLLRRESLTRIELMDNDTKIWLINRLLESNFPNIESIDWDYILHLYHEFNKDAKNKDFLWTTTDFKVSFDKMKFTVKDHKNLSLHTILSKILSALYAETGSDDMVRNPQLAKQSKSHDVEEQAESIANAAVAAVSTGVNEEEAQQQEYSLWR
ncbi:hypothetical protein FT663_01742 [Candidozyma haemuli var. vulneris]|uniref:DNA-binding protein REB1 n=1 Tax=Candidozyma haemuli TaxID=45357 RepID=A0A2V1ATE2_9ASCO|nr:hypothetical protein CXQ85_002347 [[Candida] haemuloni]KAF3989498.1 hypothetical protein FT662_02767 [[Candida] haemuloni var. vulneris]KAF3993753.1 hypothetical protein FT663_01742 [[Candida] haemuloni var. vulneris]PVH20553.1 hypothetical protein CXQ85_002347 [[Candida] haemuloni]